MNVKPSIGIRELMTRIQNSAVNTVPQTTEPVCIKLVGPLLSKAYDKYYTKATHIKKNESECAHRGGAYASNTAVNKTVTVVSQTQSSGALL